MLSNRKPQEGIKSLRRALAQAPNPRNRLDLHHELGAALFDIGEYEAAEVQYIEEFKLIQKLFPRDLNLVGAALSRRALAVGRQKGRLQESLVLNESAYEAHKLFGGPIYPGALVNLSNIATIMTRQGRLTEALEMQKQLLRYHEAETGSARYSVSISRNAIADILTQMGQLESAEENARVAVEEGEKALRGKKLVNEPRFTWALALARLGNFEEAKLQTYKYRAEVVEKRPAGDPRIAGANNLLATLEEGSRPPNFRSKGRLGGDEIRAVARAHHPDLTRCYREALREDPSVEGSVRLRFVITTLGTVGFIQPLPPAEDRKSPSSPELTRCAMQVMKQLQYPPPVGGPVWVVYPILFAPEQESDKAPESPPEPEEGSGDVVGVPT